MPMMCHSNQLHQTVNHAHVFCLKKRDNWKTGSNTCWSEALNVTVGLVDVLFYFVVMSSCVLFSLSTSCSPVLQVFRFHPVLLLLHSSLILPPHLSHISLMSTAQLPVFLLRLITSLCLYLSLCCSLTRLFCPHVSCACTPRPCAFLFLVYSSWFSFCVTSVLSFACLLLPVFAALVLFFAFLGKPIKAHFW